jgi:tetratricopeptide (TPR) repeat protein
MNRASPPVPSIARAVAIAAFLLGGCAAQPAKDAPDNTVAVEVEEGGAPRSGAARLPSHELTENILYEFLLAEIAGQRGNAAMSAQAYTDLAKRTRDPRIARRATEVAIFARMPDAAVEAAKVWHETEPDSARALQLLAGLLVNASRLDEALPYVKKLLTVQGGNPADGFLQLSRTVGSVQDKAGAQRLLQNLAADYPKLAQARYAVAQAALNAGDDKAALAEAREAQALRPDWEPAVLLEAQVLQKRSNGAALERLAGHLQKYPNSRDIRLNYARTLLADKQFPAARGEFQKLLSDFPTNTEVIYAVALLSLQLNDYAMAEDNLKRLLELDYRDKNSIRLYLGQVAEEQNKVTDALKWYSEVERGDQYIPAQIRYANVLSKQGRLDDARAHLQKVDPSSMQQRVQLILAEAQLLRDASRDKEAFGVLERALDGQPDQPELLYDYAMLAERIDRLDILESSLRKLISLRPDHAHAYNALGYSLADRNVRLAEARDLIAQALKISPDDYFIIDSMGWVLYRMGNYPEAVKYLRKAYSGRPDAEIGAHLGEVLWVMGERAEAEKVWREVSDKNPKSETLLKTIQRLKK